MTKPMPPFRILSDLDDTIKITNTQDKLVTFYRGVFRSSAFLGMAELYSEWEKAIGHSPSIHIVSSSPPMLHNRITRFLQKNSFPPAELFLRHWIKQPSIARYKMETFEAVASRYREPLILVGDDTEHDPEVLQKFRAKYPNRVLACYVRSIKGRELPEGIHGFFTAFDIACAEVSAGRLTAEQALHVGKAVMDAKRRRRLIPRFSVHPPSNFAPLIPVDEKKLLELWAKIQKKLQEIPQRIKK